MISEYSEIISIKEALQRLASWPSQTNDRLPKVIWLHGVSNDIVVDIKSLAKALEDNKTVIELDLNSTRIGKEGMDLLVELLKKNHTIQHIKLHDYDISAEIYKILEENNKLIKSTQQSTDMKNNSSVFFNTKRQAINGVKLNGTNNASPNIK